uniref:Uncharacterized protein n=1 Tax=Romanomermis culicivorax TaxID=13658 RepID=A0A915KMP1_ROMCU
MMIDPARSNKYNTEKNLIEMLDAATNRKNRLNLKRAVYEGYSFRNDQCSDRRFGKRSLV